jgi:hypothetical protein
MTSQEDKKGSETQKKQSIFHTQEFKNAVCYAPF